MQNRTFKILITLLVALGLASCSKSSDPVAVSPVPDISGTWDCSTVPPGHFWSGTMRAVGYGNKTTASLTMFDTTVTLNGSVSGTQVYLQDVYGRYVIEAGLYDGNSIMSGSIYTYPVHSSFGVYNGFHANKK